MRVQIVLFDGFDELDAIAPFAVLGSAAAAERQVPGWQRAWVRLWSAFSHRMCSVWRRLVVSLPSRATLQRYRASRIRR